MLWVNKYLNKADLAEIEKAVLAAEKATTGEIVPVLVRQSATYAHVKFLLFLAFVALGELIKVSQLLEHYMLWQSWYKALELLVYAGFSYGMSQITVFRQWFTSSSGLARQVWMRAHAEFLFSNVGQTKGKTGVLLFLSFEERMAVVLADKGISVHCKPEIWQQIVGDLTRKIRRGSLKNGLIDAVNELGKILAQKFPGEVANENELNNRLVIKED